MRPALLLCPALLLAQQPDARELLLSSAHALEKFPSYQIHSLSIIETRGGVNNHMELPTVISVRRPDLMRIESQNGPIGMTVVSDGLHTFIYFDQQKRFIKRAATSLPESSLGENGNLKDLPDMNSALESAGITGEKTMEIDDKPYDCWVVEAHYGLVNIPSKQLTIRNAVQISWISKTLGLTLQNSFTATLIVGTLVEPVEITEATTTMGLSLDSDLSDSLFKFTPPAGAVETPDWTLPGIVKPDVEGKPVPELKGAPAIKGKVALLNFCASWSKPCKQQTPVLEKLQREFRPSGFVVVYIDAGKAEPELLRSLSINAYPTLVLVNREGKVVSYEVGAQTEPVLRAALAKQGIKPVPAPPKPAAK
ncbi:MAG TPA: TlpA disulfide reductase family protein [Bryobacteraceae bacterium]|nr:TlpA disulfide reductase family protein [Bryobacteraceae bacterium]